MTGSKSNLVPYLAAILVAGTLLTGALPVCRADESADVKQTATEFFQAIGKGDAAAVKAHLAADQAAGGLGKFLEVATNTVAARDKFEEAAAAKFGKVDEKSRVDAIGDQALLAVTWLEKATIEFNGDNATIHIEEQESDPLTLTKIAGVWKITSIMPAEDLSNAIKKELSEYQSTISAMNQTAQEIRDGKYTTRADAVAAMTKRAHPERAAATQPEP